MATMTPKQRLLAAIRFEGPDCVPVSPRLWRWMLSRGHRLDIPGYLRCAEALDFDPLVAVAPGTNHFFPRGSFDLEGFSLERRQQSRGDYTITTRRIETPAGPLSERVRQPRPGGHFGIAPNPVIEEHLVKDADDLDALACLVDAWSAGVTVPDYRAIIAETGERALVQVNTCSALSHNAGDVYPLEDMMIASMENPGLIERLMDIFHRPLMDLTRRALEGGAEAVYCSTFFESLSSGWSPAIYRELFLPRIRAHVELAHAYGAPYHLYDDGRVAGSLAMLREIGVDLLSTLCPPPAGDVTLAEARRLTGDSMCLNGGVDTVNTVWRGSEADVDAAVAQAVDAAATGAGGYILGVSDSITEETPDPNVRAFFEAGRRYGRIPASG